MKKSAGRKERRKMIHANRMHDAAKAQEENDRKYRSLRGKRLYK